MLEIANLSKRYGETVALDDASIAFSAGTVHTIMGENGSGKSTLVKLLSGVVAPDRGEIRVDAVPFVGRTPAAFQAHGFATVFQEVLIAPDRNVIDNILLGYDGPFRRRMPRDRRRQAAADTLAHCARTAIDLDINAGWLPLATQQLVVLARALLRRPRILILDEATAALDFNDREIVFELIEGLAREGSLVLFVSHRMDEVLRLSHRITVLRSGRVVETLDRADASAERLLASMAPEIVEERRHA
ncbi:MAG: sugar ABC transporter ATP-binding protein [Hyphomicrobiales bacterium]|nr:sugar ABC transporter ATP-binding protein [Hyphomicrobiales bacterium]